MSSNAITEKRDDVPAGRWQQPPEMAPSTMRADEPWISRLIGSLGLAFAVLGGAVLLFDAFKWNRGMISTGWATFLLMIGLFGLLIHAANDSDLQVRRSYGVAGYAALLIGVLMSWWPRWIEGKATFGIFFLPWGLFGLALGLLFLLTFLRHETDVRWRDITTKVIGGVGAVMALVGFIPPALLVLISSRFNSFLFSHGLILVLLGLVYLCSFVSVRGAFDDLGYWTGLAIAAVGLLVLLVAVPRSIWGRDYLMPYGLTLMGCSVAYLAVAAGICLDHPFVVLTRRELTSFFYSPIAYIVLIGFVFVAWQVFVSFVFVDPGLWRDRSIMQGPAVKHPEPVVTSYLWGLFPVICLIFVVPALTMRSLSEEQRAGTLEMTLTAPVEEATVVLSKFAAALITFLLVWLPWPMFLVSLHVFGAGEKSFDPYPVISNFIALGCMGSGFISMGVFFSSLTRNQLAAAIGTFVAMLLLTLAYLLKYGIEQTGVWHKLLSQIEFITFWREALQGRLALRQVIYYLSLTVFWLFLTVKVLESRKWR